MGSITHFDLCTARRGPLVLSERAAVFGMTRAAGIEDEFQ